MRFSQKFFDDLNEIGQAAFIEKNMWVGKLVPEIIVDNLKKRGITSDDLEGCVVLTVEEAKGLLEIARDYRMYLFEHCRIPLSLSSNEAFTALRERIEQAEKDK